jgi:uncharacterized membrane protein YeaQ/YmgE (transglycosylase-associated protein family)
MHIIVFILIGFVAGLIARAIVPGRQHMGIIATTLLGVAGSFLGGMISALFSPNRRVMELQPAGIIMSIIGAIVVLAIAGAISRHRGGQRATA